MKIKHQRHRTVCYPMIYVVKRYAWWLHWQEKKYWDKKGALNPKCESKRDSIKRDLIQIVELTMKATYKLLYSVIFRPI